MNRELVLLYSTHLYNSMNRLTTITVRQDTYERLKDLGTGETFNDVLSWVLDKVEKEQKK